MNHESENRLSDAARAMREAPVHRDVLERGERAVRARVGMRRGSNRPVLLWAAGFAATAAVVGTFALAPVRGSAAEMLRIVRNADRGLRHQRSWTILPDGTRLFSYEIYAQNGRRRMIDPKSGWQVAFDGKVCDTLWPDGDVTREYGFAATPPPPNEGSARDLLAADASGPNARVKVERGIVVEGRTVDRYTLDNEGRNDEGSWRRQLTLDADPVTDRPLVLRSSSTRAPDQLTVWDYPASDTVDFHVPIGPNTRVYDLPAERAAVLAARRRPGLAASVSGQEVELVQVWVDEDGNACAATRADYAYPEDYGMQIEGFDTGFRPEKPPFSGQWMIHEPTTGGEQLMFLTRGSGKWKRTHYPDRVTVRLPVCRGKRLLGYARFTDVPVHRTHSVYSFLRPVNVPFWEKPTGVETRTQAAAAG